MRNPPKATISDTPPNRRVDVNAPLSEVVQLTRQFQRAIRIDADYGKPEGLTGYVCQGTARQALEGTARFILDTPQRAFTWTGPFGGGKSSLALALCSMVAPDKSLRRAALEILGGNDALDASVRAAFPTSKDGWLVLPVVGHRGSAVDEIAAALDRRAGTRILTRTKPDSRQRNAAVLEALVAQAGNKPSDGVLLVVDELGKFLEASANGGDDIYFFQELGDIASRCEGRLVVVGILHQAFEQYASRLNTNARDDWRKVQGRFVDIPLIAASDEVIELLGKAIDSNEPHGHTRSLCEKVAETIRHRRPSLSASFANSLDACWPLHPVTAALLGPVSRRRFGQNERSTFAFLSSVETRSFREFLRDTPIAAKQTYVPALFWDYLRVNLEPSILASPDSHRWALGVDAVERAEHRSDGGWLHSDLVKTIAILELFRNGSGLVADEDVLLACVQGHSAELVALTQVQAALEDLRRWSIVLHKRHLGGWGLTDGSDFDVDGALTKMLALVGEPDVAQLAALIRMPPVLAKRHYCETGTLRWVQPLLTSTERLEGTVSSLSKLIGQAFGAFVVVLPSSSESVRQASNHVRKLEVYTNCSVPLVVGVPKNGEQIRELGRELVAYEAIRKVSPELGNDPVGRKELEARLTDVRIKLEEQLREAMTSLVWVDDETHTGGLLPAKGAVAMPQLASALADKTFKRSPHIFSELVNRDEPSSNSAKARRELMHAMLNSTHKARLGFEGFPAEAGIYFSVLQVSGIHRQKEGAEASEGDEAQWGFFEPKYNSQSAPRAKTFAPLWKAAEKLVLDTSDAVSVSALFKLWQEEPYGVRAGVLPILWLAFVLAHQRELAVYKDGMFVPMLREVDADEVLQDSRRFEMRHVQLDEDKQQILAGVAKHLRRIGHRVDSDPLQASRALVAIVVNLPPWTLRTMSLGQATKAVRDILFRANDPHRVLFVDLPIVLETKNAGGYIASLGHALEELTAAYEKMMQGVVRLTFEALDTTVDERGLEELRRRAHTVVGISGNLQLDAFAVRLTTLTSDLPSMEGLLSLAVNKPPRDWTDRDIDAALIQLAQWALQFRQVEALSAVRDRAPTRQAIAVVFGTGRQGKTVLEAFDVSPSEQAHVEKLVGVFLKHLTGVRKEVSLAALAYAGTQLVESSQEGVKS
jgi:hypothetical protein